LLAKPFLQVVLLVNSDVVKESQYSSFLFLSTRLTESLNTYLTSSFVISCVFCFPILWYQIGSFFLPSLTLLQRQKFLRLSLMSLFAFIFVLSVSFVFILPSICAFLYKCSSISSKIFSIQMQPTIYEFVVVTLRFLVLSALFSQVPVFVLWLIQWDTSILQDLTRQRQRIWICCILLSAFLTPPDIACQLISSLFMFLVLEVTFFYAFLRIHYQTIKR
jgi:Sec-independent protein secretion pathway component TatC